MRIEGPSYIVSRSVIDRTAHLRTNDHVPTKMDLPRSLRDAPVGPKIVLSPQEYGGIVDELVDREALIEETVGGNGGNAAHRKKEFRSKDAAPVIVRTWVGSDGFRSLLHTDLDQPGMRPDLIDYDGITPQALVIPLMTPQGKDRMLFSVHPEGLPSEFASGIPHGTDYAVVNSLGGDTWATSLEDGIKELSKRNIPYAYTPGSLQLNAVNTNGDGKLAVYKAIQSAAALSVNRDELEDLVKGANMTPSKDIRILLDQGLDLGAAHIFATDGSHGAYGASRDGIRAKVATTQVDNVVSLVGAGDAFMAGSTHILFQTGDPIQALRWGSVSGSFAVETVGAHTDPPSREAIEHRLRNRGPAVVNLFAA